jgi:nicotinamidase/pyrazinamidase
MKGKQLSVHLVVIDPQNDFCDINGAALPVPGAVEDMKRTAKMIERIGHRLDDIHVTLDSHRLFDIAHPLLWTDQNGNSPKPFTAISFADVKNSVWTPRNPTLRQMALDYTGALEAKGKYTLLIWPPHCLIGTEGHNVHPVLNAVLQEWSLKEVAMVDYVTKGSNWKTEHYGALEAEVPDPNDPGTSLNTDFLTMLASADIIGIDGEASSHCVMATVNQIADNIGQEHIKKFHLLTDGMSPVPAIPNVVDFPAIAQAWLKDMKRKGMTLTTTTDFLA